MSRPSRSPQSTAKARALPHADAPASDHPERPNPLTEVQALAQALIGQHLDESWSFRFDHARMRAGSCNYARRQISLSRYLVPLMTAEQVDQTLRHEIAHALAGQSAGHGAAWRGIAAQIGYAGGRTYEGPVPQDHRWVGRCPNGHEVFRHRRPGKPVSCSRCARGFDDRFLIRWYDRRDA